MLRNCTSAAPEEESTLMSSREREGSMPRRDAVVEPWVAPGGEIYEKGGIDQMERMFLEQYFKLREILQ